MSELEQLLNHYQQAAVDWNNVADETPVIIMVTRRFNVFPDVTEQHYYFARVSNPGYYRYIDGEPMENGDNYERCIIPPGIARRLIVNKDFHYIKPI